MRDQPLDCERVTGPAVAAVSLEDAKAHCRVDDDDFDSLLQSYVDAAIGYVDGLEGILGRALIEQSWTLYLDQFASVGPFGGAQSYIETSPRRRWDLIRLPMRPLIAVDSIHYVDPSGATLLLDPAAYQVMAGERAEIVPAAGLTWPSTQRQPRAVAIAFRAGYAKAKTGPTAPPNPADVPPQIISAIKLMIGDLFLNRESQVVETTRSALIENLAADRLLAPFKSYL